MNLNKLIITEILITNIVFIISNKHSFRKISINDNLHEETKMRLIASESRTTALDTTYCAISSSIFTIFVWNIYILQSNFYFENFTIEKIVKIAF